jgi:hypothetical protein
LGIFNLNNRSLFVLALLDDYTCNFSHSETPFTSWVSSTMCRYQVHRSSIPFIGEKVFRAAWFSYIRLIRFGGDMTCPRCGPSPKVTIWDGVTLAFARKNLLPTIQPPTRTDEQSERKPAIKPLQGLQVFPDRVLRKLVQTILVGTPLRPPALSETSDNTQPMKSPSKDDQVMMERIELIPQAVSKLADESLELGLLFDRWFSMKQLLASGTSPPTAYRNLFLQVRKIQCSSYTLWLMFM